MFPKPVPSLIPNTYAYESSAMVKPTGFREYDARWLFEKEINLMGIQALGMGLGTLIHELGVKPEIVTAHDYRAYSASIKMALVSGLMAAGIKVHDIGLGITPMAYFAQFDLDVPAVAMVTASHNDNGWTGVKMGANRPLTFGPDEMGRLKEIVLEGSFDMRGGGSYVFVENFPERYIADLTTRAKLKRRSRSSPPAATARRALSPSAFLPPLARKLSRSTASLTTVFRVTIRIRKIWKCCMRSPTRCARAGLRSGWVLMVTATAAASSTIPARRFSPTRSASCWRATSPRSIRVASSSST